LDTIVADHRSSRSRRLAIAVRHLVRDPAIRAGTFAFFLTRLLILAVILLTSSIVFEPAVSTPFGPLHESNISFHNLAVGQALSRVTLGADSAWIMNIAINGYEKEPFNTTAQHTWAYFPLYPLLLRLCARITGEFPLTGMALSSLFFLLALIIFHKTVGEFGYEQPVADRAVFYLAAFPLSYFFLLAQTESLFLLLTVGAFSAARRQRWWLAGVCGALASATRFAGVFLIVPLAILYWQSYGRQIRASIGSLVLVPLGLVAFMIYLRAITGNPLAFADIQVTWGHSAGFFWRPLLTYLSDPLRLSAGWDFRLLNFVAATIALLCGAVLLRHKEWALGLFALISIIVPMSFQPLLQSLARYVMVIFPVFIVLATVGRSQKVDQIIRSLCIGLLCLMSALLAARVTIAFS
jgi:Mannosyltransferase (PIG-V)